MLGWPRLACFWSCFSFSALALGAVSQPAPDGTPLPQPVPESEITLVGARGFGPEALTLQGLFSARGESIDPVADAVAAPGTFQPSCGGTDVTVELVLNGGGCKMALAWYNATGAAPSASDLHVIMPALHEEMQCDDAEFCPLATMSSVPDQHRWVPTVYRANVCNDSAYAGGAIGFALIADPDSAYCTATKYSEAAANVQCTVCSPVAPWVTALIYPSSQQANTYFLAFEDLPMSAEDWRSGGAAAADGDFNDFVFIVGNVCHGSCDGTDPGGTGGSAGASSGGATSSGGAESGGASSAGDAGTSADGGTQSAGGSDGSGGTPPAGSGGVQGAPGGPPSGPCTPNQTVPCPCPDGSQGAFVCNADGNGYTGCYCTTRERGCGCSIPRRDTPLAGLVLAALAALGLWQRKRR